MVYILCFWSGLLSLSITHVSECKQRSYFFYTHYWPERLSGQNLTNLTAGTGPEYYHVLAQLYVTPPYIKLYSGTGSRMIVLVSLTEYIILLKEILIFRMAKVLRKLHTYIHVELWCYTMCFRNCCSFLLISLHGQECYIQLFSSSATPTAPPVGVVSVSG